MDSLLNQTTEPDRGVLDSLVAQTLSETAPGIRAHALKMIKFFEERPQAVAHALERYVEIVAISKRSVDAKCESALTNLPSGESESAHLLDKTQRMSAVASVAAEYATLILKSAILFDDSRKIYVGSLVSSETLIAGATAASATDEIPVFRNPGFDYLGF